MASKQEIAWRFESFVMNPPQDTRKIPGNSVLDDYPAERFRKEVPHGRMTLFRYAPEAVGEPDGPMGLAFPSHGIEVVTFPLGTGLTEQTFFGLNKYKNVERAHSVRLVQPTFPFIDSLTTHQSEALLVYANDPENNEEQLVIARELPQAKQMKLDAHLQSDAKLKDRVDRELAVLRHNRIVTDMNREIFPLG